MSKYFIKHDSNVFGICSKYAKRNIKLHVICKHSDQNCYLDPKLTLVPNTKLLQKLGRENFLIVVTPTRIQ